MEYLVSAEEMRRADHCVIEEYGVPSLVLMERAALASVELMEREGFDLSRVLVVSGSGNNGGDGFAMARILYLKGIEAELWFVGNPDHLSKEAALQKKIYLQRVFSRRNHRGMSLPSQNTPLPFRPGSPGKGKEGRSPYHVIRLVF